MSKPFFEVSVNNEKTCTAGLPHEFGVLNSMLTWVKRQDDTEALILEVGGLDSTQDDEYKWLLKPLKIGDTIQIKIVDPAEKSVSSATIRSKESNEFILKNKIDYYYRLKEELKDHLNDQH